jgi:YebC/PmpR family DNA-binding regulatory protein
MGRGPSIAGRKGAEDARRGKIFTKIIREITVAARAGSDPAGNSRLRAAIDKALGANMTKETMDRAVKRGAGGDGNDDMAEIRYEGYGPGGVAILIDCLSDNTQRTVADVRHALNKHGGNLGTSGSVAFQFSRLGEVIVQTLNSADEEKAFELALNAGADDVQAEAGFSTVLCKPDQFEFVKKAMLENKLKIERSDVVMRPQNYAVVTPEIGETLSDLIDWLEDMDDVQAVYHNGELPE